MSTMKDATRYIGIVSLLAIVAVVGQMRHDGVIIINCSEYPVYANMTYTVLGVKYSRKSAELPKFNKLTVVKYPPELDNCTVTMIFYMQPKGKGDFKERGRSAGIPAHRGECFYITPPTIENPYRLCEIERILMGIRTCPDRWVLDDNFQRKTLPPAVTSKDQVVTRAPAKTTKDGGPAGKTVPKAIEKLILPGKSKKKMRK